MVIDLAHFLWAYRELTHVTCQVHAWHIVGPQKWWLQRAGFSESCCWQAVIFWFPIVIEFIIISVPLRPWLPVLFLFVINMWITARLKNIKLQQRLKAASLPLWSTLTFHVFKESLAVAYGTQKLLSALFQLHFNARVALIMDAFPELSEKQKQPVVFV